MGKLKILLALVLITALGGFAFFILQRGNGQFSTERTLPDGTLLRIGEISFTNGVHSFQAKSISGWKAKVVQVLPKTLSSRLGILPWGGCMTINGSGIGTNLGFFTFCDGPLANGGFVFTRLEVFDDLGNVFDGGGARGTLGTSSFDGRNMLRIDGWTPSAFPRRGKTLGLRYFENRGHGWQQVAGFLIPNPAPGNYPTWIADPLPATKTNENLAVTLLALRSGLSQADEERPARTNEIAVTQATLRVAESGRSANSWRPIAVEISDATGNHWMPFPHTISTRHEEEVGDVFSFEGALWPGEAAWKMRFEFSRIADYEPGEVFTFGGITVPGATQVITLDNTTNVWKHAPIAGHQRHQSRTAGQFEMGDRQRPGQYFHPRASVARWLSLELAESRR